jgi:hypothetical protein
MDFESWRHCGGTLHYRASVIIVRRSVNWAQRTFERPRECAVERPQLAQAVSKRALHSSAVETGSRERPTTASASVGNGKATLQNLAIFRFDTASAGYCLM